MKVGPAFLLLFSIVNASAETRLSLAEVLDRAVRSPRMSVSEASVEEAQSLERMSAGMFHPSVSLRENFVRTNDPVGVFGAKLRQREFTANDFALDELNAPESVTHWATRLEVVQPLLHSTTDLKNREAARSYEEAARLRHEHRLQQTRLSASRMYHAASALRERQALIGEGVDLLVNVENSYQLMSAPTAATTTNYLITQSVRLGLTAQKSGLASMEANLKRSLASLLGLPSGEAIVLTDPLPGVSEGGTPSAEAVASERADVRAAQKDAEAAQSALGAAKGEWGPMLDAIGGYNLTTGKWSDFGRSYDLGVMLTWPLFQGGRLGKIDGAKARLSGAREMARVARFEAEATLQSAESDLIARKGEYRMIESAESKASEAFRLAKKRYAEGILSLFDYSRSIQNWVEIRQQLVEARRSVAEANAQLLFERGAL